MHRMHLRLTVPLLLTTVLSACGGLSGTNEGGYITLDGNITAYDEGHREGPVTVSGPAFTEALERYIRLRNLEFSRLNFTGLPAIQLRNLARYAGMPSVKYIA